MMDLTKLQNTTLKTSSESAVINEDEFDLFQMPEGTAVEEQRAFEIWWRKMTGRYAIVLGGVEYKATLQYPKDNS